MGGGMGARVGVSLTLVALCLLSEARRDFGVSPRRILEILESSVTKQHRQLYSVCGNIGPDVSAGGLQGFLATVGPATCCEETCGRNHVNLATASQDWIALINRGNCTFVKKIQNAQKAGASGVVVANNDLTNPDELLIMGSSSKSVSIDIPSVFISYNSGVILRSALDGLANDR